MSETRNAFAEEADDTLKEYRPINSIAVVAFIVSLVSFLAVTDIFFLFIPILAIILALVGFTIFAASSQPLMGRRLCTIALCIGLFVTTWMVSYQNMRRGSITRQAEPIFQEWLGYIKRGELYQAHQLTMKYMERELPETNLEYHYTKITFQSGMNESEKKMFLARTPKKKFEKFANEEPLKTIIAEAPHAEFEFVRTEGQRRAKSDDFIYQVYRMNYQSGGNPKSLDFRVALVRQDLGSYFQAHWYVPHVTSLSGP